MDKSSNARITGILVTVLAAAGYAGNNVLVALAYGQGATPTAVLFLRYVVLIAGLLIILPVTAQSLALPRRFYGHAIAAGFLACFDSLCLITAFGLIPIGLALLILYFFHVSWYWPLVLFAVGSILGGLVFGLLDAKVPQQRRRSHRIQDARTLRAQIFGARLWKSVAD